MRTEGPNFVRRKSDRRLLQLMLLGRTCTCACAPSACGGGAGLCASEPNLAKHRFPKPIVARTCVGRLFLSREALIKVLVSPVVPPPGGTLLLIVPCL